MYGERRRMFEQGPLLKLTNIWSFAASSTKHDIEGINTSCMSTQLMHGRGVALQYNGWSRCRAC